MTSIYAFDAPGETRAGFEYIRYGNPTRSALEACVAALENAPEDCPALAYSSGMAAIDGALRLLRPGDHLLLARDVYGGTSKLVQEILIPAGIEVERADATDTDAFTARINDRTRLVWIESPSNPLMLLTDIAAISEVAHAHGALVAIDSTFATPCFQNPLDLGVDIVMHSSTKYLGGHSDLLGGLLVTGNPDLRKRLFEIQKMTGAVAAPFDCWLTLRGIKTLAPRMRLHEENALAVAHWLESQAQVERVYYPGLLSHPHHELAKRQMRGFGGMVAFTVKDDTKSVYRMLKSTKIFTFAGSLGGVESILSYPALMSHVALPRELRYELGITDGLIRLSIGLEDKRDLIADLASALEVL
jgi:cystathionine beta-lyase/cystathionine gamma-synthase